MTNMNLPEMCKSLQPGTKVSLELTSDKKTATVTRKNCNYSSQDKIEVYPDGTRRAIHTISPNIPAKEKKETMETMKKEGKTQKQIAEATGTSQATVSRILNT